ncbi:polyprenyl synthetase family protein [Ruania halotolerans]|uniref:polyprenyl synthetase family protein n=1 Tax=Ruania halotolerans TaxID=2897773 RepID=UPI001E6483F6|nr:polyprenyl synthetase family protein [Ruania halotolerans]UFU06871.1 polyprenyl synthetase family protein [Ruania halotolerans]
MSDVSASVQARLDAFFAARAAAMAERGAADLWAALRAACTGGKRLRPRLVEAGAGACGGAPSDRVAFVGAAVELLHTAFVVHDDVIDGDLVRRGRPNVAGTFMAAAVREGIAQGRARRYGDAAGIIAGDLALAGAVRLVAGCGGDLATVDRLMVLMDEALLDSAAGELADVRYSLGQAAEIPEILRMDELKTAAYSFSLPLRAGAVLAGALPEVVEQVGEIGRLLGVAYQLRDDLGGMFGDEGSTGKSPLSDLREGKRTVLLAHAARTQAWEALRVHVGDPQVDEQGLATVRRLLTECGARAEVEGLAAEHERSARERALELGAGGTELLGAAWLAHDLAWRTEDAA